MCQWLWQDGKEDSNVSAVKTFSKSLLAFKMWYSKQQQKKAYLYT